VPAGDQVSTVRVGEPRRRRMCRRARDVSTVTDENTRSPCACAGELQARTLLLGACSSPARAAGCAKMCLRAPARHAPDRRLRPPRRLAPTRASARGCPSHARSVFTPHDLRAPQSTKYVLVVALVVGLDQGLPNWSSDGPRTLGCGGCEAMGEDPCLLVDVPLSLAWRRERDRHVRRGRGCVLSVWSSPGAGPLPHILVATCPA